MLSALLTLLETDFRAGLYAMVGPAATRSWTRRAQHARVEETVANCEREAAVGRIRAWIASDPTEGARALGDRLWILTTETNPWFTTTERSREVVPQATYREIADGPMARPDLTAEAVREVTRSAAR